ncbi:hypothetical protein Bca52824_039545 [Brassica carinata]|uniref:Uncharacterized protein n=1 Tax=Brassica carinata TaxID=52824 RepID=A0A8X7UWZ9_BRACI|nr:hypothetical protein Bca52824_039545 [Brassica carinata]
MELELCDASTCSASPTTAAQSLVSNTLILVRVVRILKLHQWLCRQLQALLLAVTTVSFTRSSVSSKRHTYRQLEIKKDIVKLHQRFMSSLCDLVSSCRCRVKWRPATHLVNVKSNRSFLFIMPE